MFHRLRALIVLSACMSLLFVGQSSADPAHVPGGPCLQENQKVSLSSVANYQDVVRSLAQIERTSKGMVTVESAGQSGEGRELLYATIGEGEDVFWLQARIHGDELHSTEAALQVLNYLTGGSPDARLIRENLTVVVIPMYNPDGRKPTSGSRRRPLASTSTATGRTSPSPSRALSTSCGKRFSRGSLSTFTT
jgi:murein tripeptide amidase MpaA